MDFFNIPNLPKVTTLPAAGSLGRLVTFVGNGHVYHDNGSSWDDITAQGSGANVDELYKELQFAQLTKYVEFTYVGGNLTNKGIWEDNSKVVKLFNANYVYMSGNLTSIVVTRILDSATYTKTLGYTSGNLASVTVT